MKTLPVPLSHVVTPPLIHQEKLASSHENGDEGFARHLRSPVSEKPTDTARPHDLPPSEAMGFKDASTRGFSDRSADPRLPVHIDVPEMGAAVTPETLYPLTLAVVGYLSMLAKTETHMPHDAALVHAESASYVVTNEKVYETPSSVEDAKSLSVDEVTAARPQEPAIAEKDTGSDAASTEPMTMAWPVVPSPWQKWRMTITENASGTMVRLRDYTLTPDGRADAAQWLRDQARQGGLTLSRVVVNARDIEGKETI